MDFFPDSWKVQSKMVFIQIAYTAPHLIRSLNI